MRAQVFLFSSETELGREVPIPLDGIEGGVDGDHATPCDDVALHEGLVKLISGILLGQDGEEHESNGELQWNPDELTQHEEIQ